MSAKRLSAGLIWIFLAASAAGVHASENFEDALATQNLQTKLNRGLQEGLSNEQNRAVRNSRRKSGRPARDRTPNVNWLEFLDISGAASIGFFQREKQFTGRKDFGTGFVSLVSRPREFFGLRFYIDGQLSYAQNAETSFTQSDLRELFLEKSFGDFDMKLGRQITVWGRVDRSNPTDVFSVRDMTKLVFFDEDQRTGVTASQFTYNVDLFRLIAIVQHEWREPKFAFASVPNIEIISLFPGETEPQFGFKLDRSGGAFDFSVSYASVFDRVPDLRSLPSTVPGTTNVGLLYSPISVIGGDCAFNLNSLGVRAEVAYHQTKDNDGKNPAIKNPFTYFVLDTDYALSEAVKVGIQLHHRSIHDWVSPYSFSNPLDVALAQTVEVISNQRSPSIGGVAGRVGIRVFRESVTLDLGYLQWTDFSSSVFRARIGYSINDDWKMLLGGDFYDGDRDTFLGRYKDLSGGFGELRRSF